MKTAWKSRLSARGGWAPPGGPSRSGRPSRPAVRADGIGVVDAAVNGGPHDVAGRYTSRPARPAAGGGRKVKPVSNALFRGPDRVARGVNPAASEDLGGELSVLDDVIAAIDVAKMV